MNEQERKLLHSTYPIEIALLVVALVVFLIIIGNVLVRINDNLGVTENQAAAVNRSASSLPGLIGSITSSLQSIRHDTQPITGQLTQIDSGLAQASKGLDTAESNLAATNDSLSHTEGGLVTALGYADRVKNGSIAIVNELGTAGGQLATAINLLTGVHSDASDISGLATRINGNVAGINNTGLAGLLGLVPPLGQTLPLPPLLPGQSAAPGQSTSSGQSILPGLTTLPGLP